MESPNAPPAHDFFTPAWLKLPDPQVSKKTVSPSSESGVDTQQKRYSNSFSSNSNRKELVNSAVNQSNSFANSFHDSSQPYLSSSRHNSFGSEQQFNKANAQTIGNNVNGFRSKKYGNDSSQRPGYRSNGYREKTSSVGHHSNTKVNRNSDAFKSNFNSSAKKFANKSSDYSVDNESHPKSASNEENCNVFNREFPSLVNDVNGGQKGAPDDNSSFHSAWSNNATKSKVLSTSKKFQLIHSSVANFDNIDSGNKSETNSIANASKPMHSSPVYRNLSLMAKGKGGIMKENAVYSKIQPMLTKASAQTTPAMEILVKNPKKRSNKTDFLNSIRSDRNKEDKEFDDKDCHQFEQKFDKMEISAENRNNINGSLDLTPKLVKNNIQMSYENDIKNSENINNKYFCRQPEEYEDEEDMRVLSSSLEAEHRLLMELGWKAESDDDPSYAPLTEDEVKEFKDLINARNGFKRNTNLTQTQTTTLSNQTTHLNTSPKKWPTNDGLDVEVVDPSEDEEESTSSSEED